MKMTTFLAACALGAASLAVSAQTNYAQMNTYEQMVGTASAGPVNTSNGPLTRQQVQADLARARTDGTIPRFGNPDPYGPGRMSRGAPSYNGRMN